MASRDFPLATFLISGAPWKGTHPWGPPPRPALSLLLSRCPFFLMLSELLCAVSNASVHKHEGKTRRSVVTPCSFLPGDSEAMSEGMLCPAPCNPAPQAPELVLTLVTTQRHNTYLLTFGPGRPEGSPDTFVSLQANTRRELRGFEDTIGAA